MKKLFLIALGTLVIGLSSNSASAQGISVELDLGYNIPGGDFGDLYDGGIGVAVHPRIKLGGQMAAGLSVGVNGFAGVDETGGTGNAGSISAAGVTTVMGTFQYKLFDKKITPYGEIGVGLWTGEVATADASNVANGGIGTESVSSVGFSPEVGVMVGFLNLSASYTIAGDFNYTQIALGFRFGAK